VINGEILRLLVVEESESNAESVTNILRNARQSVQLIFTADTERLESILSTQHPDIVLCGSNREHGYDFEGESA
jgi:CheY-like chemotaxis protein